MAADAIDDDVEQAIVSLWKQDPLEQLAALFPQPPGNGRLKSPQPDVYAQVKSEPARAAERYAVAKGPPVRIDFRKASLLIRGKRADVVKGVKVVLAVFNDQLGMPGKPTLTLPSGAAFVRWLPLNDGVIAEEPDTKAGQDIWVGTIEAEVRSRRTG